MPKEIVNPSELPAPRGFNHAILASGGKVLFLAGQDASDAEGKIVAPGDLTAQFEQVLHNLRAVVQAAGGTMHDIVKLNIFVKDRDAYVANLDALGKTFRRYFEGHYPAMALFEVSAFFRDENLIEMEGFAYLED
ncbi:MAG: RidA family protein [Candidatus Promineifilaceae bacterium]|nr:RidA family protein [Candidatus Promineifilaceae bacterium]